MVDNTLPQERRIFYVYVIFRLNGVPCYVGKGKGNRWKHHHKKAYNPHLRRIYEHANGELPIVKVREYLTNAEAIDTEIAIIAAIGRELDGSGPLVNITLGGDGLTGWVPSPETRAKIGKGNSGKTASAATRLLMSLASKGRPKTEDHKRKIGAAQKGKVISPETIEKTRLGLAKVRDIRSAAISAHHASMTPEEKARRSANISAAKKAAYKADPTIGVRLSKAARARTNMHLHFKKKSTG